MKLTNTEGAIRSPSAAAETVRASVAGWEGVATHSHRFGGIEFRLGRRELGHLHPRFADLPVPRRVRDELVAAGWATVPMRTDAEIANVIALFRLNYERTPNADRM